METKKLIDLRILRRDRLFECFPIHGGNSPIAEALDRSFMTHNGRSGRVDIATSLFQIFGNGLCLTVQHDDLLDRDKQKVIYLEAQESDWIRSVQRGITLLRTEGIIGPISVRFGFIGGKGAYLLPSESHLIRRVHLRPLGTDDLMLDSSRLDSEATGMSLVKIAQAVADSFLVAWRTGGIEVDYAFQNDPAFRSE